jgi:hypothetical protein
MGLIDNLIGPVAGILERVIPDKSQAAALAHEIATMSERHAQDIAMAQIAVNKEEAKGNWFQSSWRPATAWVCVLGFMMNFLVSPIANAFGVDIPQAGYLGHDASVDGYAWLGGLRPKRS